jgi:hypothetical protein
MYSSKQHSLFVWLFVRASLIIHCDVIGGFFFILRANHMVDESTQLSQFTEICMAESGLQLQSFIIRKERKCCSLGQLAVCA